MPKVNKTKKQLENELEEVREALKQRNMEAEAFSRAPTGGFSPSKMVPVKNFSANAVGIPYEYGGRDRTLLLDSQGIKQVGMLPLEVWLELERESDLVRKGFIARTDQPITNINIIDDVEEFISASSDKEIVKRVDEIENYSTLYKVHDYIEIKDKDSRTPRELFVLQHVRNKIFELTNVQIIDGDLA